jgi:hypothetical protein
MRAANASLDLRAAHKLRDARAQLLVCSAANCPADVRTECLRRVEELNAGIPTIVFEAKDSAGNDVAGVKVTMDGQLLSDRLEGTAMSLDPGEHEFVFEAPGGMSVRKTLVLRETVKDRRETIVFGATPAAAASGATPAPGLAVEPTTTPTPAMWGASQPAATVDPNDGHKRTLAIALGGAGIAGVALGSVFGAIALSKTNEEKTCISTPAKCSTSTQSAHDAAVSNATISTIGFVAGGALLAGGAIVYFLVPKAQGATQKAGLQVAPSVGGVVVTGHF